ncbi:uncharacterized protein MONOS_14032 [Monocercomonoides exilis]|uniref:uncharacterized protein n=1 Tax=Monocercomonoides exilis TaxID=2049356 RepID=UPI00355A99CD|nr:hypothetical protein MONOS_14032 [Monocercomonoides exilis]
MDSATTEVDGCFPVCGSSGRACRTIKYSFFVTNPSASPNLINVAAGQFEEEEMNIGKLDIAVTGKMDETTIISKISDVSLFSLSEGKLSLDSFSIIHSSQAAESASQSLVSVSSNGIFNIKNCKITTDTSQQNEFSSPFFDITRGSGTIVNCEIRSVTFSNAPLIRATDAAEVILTNTKIISIHRNLENGAAIESEMVSDGIIKINNVTLSDCRCLSGNGGGICCLMRSDNVFDIGNSTAALFSSCAVPVDATKKGKGGGIFLIVEDSECDFSLKNLTFSNCSAWKGRNLFVDAPTLKDIINNSSIGFSRTGMNDEDIMGYEQGYQDIPVTLIPFLKSFSPPAFVGGMKERDFNACGFIDYPCSTIEKVASVRFHNSARSLILRLGFVWKEEIELNEYNWSFQCEEAGDEIVVAPSTEPTSQALITTNQQTQFINVIFLLPETLSQTTKQFMCCQGFSLRLTSCEIKPITGITSIEFAPFAATNGMIIATNLVCSSFSLESQPLISLAGIGVIGEFNRITAEAVSTTAECGFFEVKDRSTLKMSNSLITSSETPSTNAFLKISTASTIELVNNTLSNFERNGFNGGCFECTLTDGAFLSVIGGSFNNCKIVGGNGGALSIKMDAQSRFCIGNTSTAEDVVSFSSCSASKKTEENTAFGGGIYLHAEENAKNFVLKEISFIGCTAEKGNDLFVYGYNLSAIINEDSFAFHPTLTDFSKFVGFEKCTTDTSYYIPLVVFLWNNFTSNGFASESEGGDFGKCGFSEVPCKTVNHLILTRLTPFPAEHNTITILSEASIHMAFDISLTSSPPFSSLPSLIIKGNSCGTKLSIFDEKSVDQASLLHSSIELPLMNLTFSLPPSLNETRSWLVSSNKSLSFFNCSLELREGNGLTYSLILIEGGTFFASQMYIGSISSEIAISTTTPLIVIQVTDLASFMSCSFENVNHMQGNGSCIEVENLLTSAKLIISNCTFSECFATAKEGAGGALLGSIADGAFVEVNDSSFNSCRVPDDESFGRGLGGGMYLDFIGTSSRFQFCNISFESCVAWKGKNIFLRADSLSSKVTKKTMNFTFDVETSETPDLDELSGVENGNTNYMIPLVLLLRNFSGSCFVGGENGIDDFLCGFEDYSCQTILYAGAYRFGASKALIRLLPTFSFKDRLNLDSQALYIDSIKDEAQILVESSGKGEGNALIETSIEVNISGICFVLPSTFSPSTRTALFSCSASSLSFSGCSISVPSFSLMYSFLVASNGTIIQNKLKICNTAFETTSGFIFRGDGTKGSFIQIDFQNVTTEAENGLIRVDSGASLSVENSQITDSSMISSEVIRSQLTTAMQLKNSSFRNIERRSGNGALLVGAVGGGRKYSIANCSIEKSYCIENGNIKGGGIVAEVKRDGEWEFEKNNVKDCTVDGLHGFGGGMYLRFAEASVKYSMKSNHFESNDAKLGKDVYLLCPSPQVMVNAIYWEGSAKENDATNTKWVFDDSVPQGANISILFYLFPPSTEIIYVESGVETFQECGSKVYPCLSIPIGVDALNENKKIVHLNNENELNETIDRNGLPLTIEGERADRSELKIYEFGCFSLNSGTAATTFTLSQLIFVLPQPQHGTESLVNSMIFVSTGRFSVVNCLFGADDELGVETDMLISSVIGGFIGFDSVSLSKLKFSGESGITHTSGGRILMENCNVTSVSSDGEGLMIGEAGSIVSLKNILVKTSVNGNGHFLKSINASQIEISEGCIFEGCQSVIKDGGFLHCETSDEGELSIKDSKILLCSVSTLSGRGGGIFLHLLSEANCNYQFTNIIFSKNTAQHGNDVFLSCVDLNKSVSSSRFETLVGDRMGTSTEMEGMDGFVFCDSPIDLSFLLNQRKASENIISDLGFDILGCGTEEYPCNSFWRGYMNINFMLSKKTLNVIQSTKVTDAFDLSGFTVRSSDELLYCSIFVDSTISSSLPSSSSSLAVFSSSSETSFQRIAFQIPSGFASSHRNLFSSNSESDLSLINVSFSSSSSSSSLDYTLITAIGNFVLLKRCAVEMLSFSEAPLQLMCSSTFNESNFLNVSSPNCEEGGIMKVALSEDNKMIIENSSMKLCSCSLSNGRGGAVFINCSSANQKLPFIFSSTIFEENNAFTGKNAFIISSDLNQTVSELSFAFDYLIFADDSNAFTGSDGRSIDVDLFRYLIWYQSDAVYLSSAGCDVKRCGSEADPCESFWKGMMQVGGEASRKKMIIDRSTIIRDMFDLSNFSIESQKSEIEEEVKPALNMELNSMIKNQHFLLLESISIFTLASFVNAEKAVILNEIGELQFSNCALSSYASTQQPGDYSFVISRSGIIKADKLLIQDINAIQSIFVLEWNCKCLVSEVTSISVRIVSGSLFFFEEETKINGNSASLICNGSSFNTITRLDNGPSWLSVKTNQSIELQVNNSVFESIKAGDSEKGGMGFFVLTEESSMKISQCKILQCGCSNTKGKGGGVYIFSELFGKLDFAFIKCDFDGNIAWRGKDVFVECRNIESQINETQFKFDIQDGRYNRINAIYGIDAIHNNPTDLMDFITIYQQSTIFVSSGQEMRGEDSRQCEPVKLPCKTVSYGVDHVYGDLLRMLIIDEESTISKEMELENLILKSLNKQKATIRFDDPLEKSRDYIIDALNDVLIERISFSFSSFQQITQGSVFHAKNCSLAMAICTFTSFDCSSPSSVNILISVDSAVCSFRDVNINNLACKSIATASGGFLLLQEVNLDNVKSEQSCIIAKDTELDVTSSNFVGVDVTSDTSAIVLVISSNEKMHIDNCTFDKSSSLSKKGISATLMHSTNVIMDSCLFSNNTQREKNENESVLFDDVCVWNGSMLHLINCSAIVMDASFSTCDAGGLSVNGGCVSLQAVNFTDIRKQINKYPSSRRNIICTNSGLLDVVSLKGGDGLKDNTSLWILSDGCALSGLAAERPSPFFMPTLQAIDTNIEGNEAVLTFTGALLLPCNLSFRIITAIGDVELIDRHDFHEDSFVSENSTIAKIPAAVISDAPDTADVYGCILFGDAINPSSTELAILKNKTESKTGNDNLVKGGKEGKSSWALIIAVIFVVLFLIVLVVSIIVTVRWRKQKRRTKELEIIVEDTVKKDPKAFEMVTMEMSPEAQWRRAEREAEKKNEERIKKRAFENSLGHSESSEHLLSESGSTEYIFGQDSDKIPEWMLEKVDEKEEEEEEARKRTPSPSISSTSTTSTTDSDSTFVRGEDLCPTTSSMSNLVDAMACSSPHEKLIVDLRDSLFMLLHGRNKTKEMAIGSLQEREMTAAQILFWVANLALHSFDEMENELSSLANLSPHIILFSEHMVICIALHSDCSSDSDTSSISSSTVVTSASDDDDDDSLPSSAFEDEDDFKKECLRWKAPELLINKKMMATKEAVSFSIGMMLWECLTLQIPFGEYEAEVAGQKIVKGERPDMSSVEEGNEEKTIKACLSHNPSGRPSLVNLKRGFISHFPKGMAILTVADAIDFEQDTQYYAKCSSSGVSHAKRSVDHHQIEDDEKSLLTRMHL